MSQAPAPHPHALTGRRIVITRARSQAADLAGKIEACGGEVVVFPTIEIRPPDDYGPLDESIRSIGRYDWIFFTSVNGVEHFLARLRLAGKSVADLAGIKTVAIGTETARRLRAAGLSPDIVPARFQAEGVLEALTPGQIRDRRVLLPRALKAREILPETLKAWGGKIDVVPAYRTVAPASDAVGFRALQRQRPADAITFTSPSTVAHFADFFAGEDLGGLLGPTVIACIGPITAGSVRELGLAATIVATEYTTSGLVAAIVDHFKR